MCIIILATANVTLVTIFLTGRRFFSFTCSFTKALKLSVQ